MSSSTTPPATFTLEELAVIRSVVKLMTMRGAWQEEELEDAGKITKRIAQVLQHATQGHKLVWAFGTTAAPAASSVDVLKTDGETKSQ